MSEKDEKYVIKGTVLGKSGKALAGFEVTALDKDLMGSDLLGSGTTDADGRFEINYTEAQFAGFLEKGPDVYLVVKNDKGQSVYIGENAIRNNAGHEEVYHIVLDDAEALTPTVSVERKQFQQIILKNPNYFGTIPQLENTYKPVIVKWDKHTHYEELDCVGLRRADNVLEAVFHVKLPYGFGGMRCSDGTKEWVTFWVDYQDGNGWIQAGPPVSVNVHDLSVADAKGIWYAAELPFQPKVGPTSCKDHQVVRLRAILSWSTPHFDPNTLPVWGNRKDAWIFLKSKRRFFLRDLAVFPTDFLDTTLALPLGMSTLDAAIDLHKELGVGIEQAKKCQGHDEPHRLNMQEYLKKNPNYYGHLSQAKTVAGIQADLYKLPAGFQQWVELPSNLNDLIPVIPQLEQTKYEQLTCLGLYPEVDVLESTVAIKLPTGYLTDPCFVGSTEYVAYYIDYGSGWEYVGTDKFQVHDVADALNPSIPPHKPLMYGSRMYVKDMRTRATQCSKEQVIMARAILSWNVDPTGLGPNFPPTWGNVLDRRIEVRPTLKVGDKPRITHVSNVDVAQILGGKAQVGGTGYIHPFGNDLGILGVVDIPGVSHYRLQYSKDGGMNWATSKNSRPAQRQFTGITDFRDVVGDGWFSIAQLNIDRSVYIPTLNCYFASAGLNGDYLLRLQIGDGVTVTNSSDPVHVLIDNTPPALYKFAGEVIPNRGVTVIKPCGRYKGDDFIEVRGNFHDAHYASYQLYLLGGGITTPQALTSPAVGAFGTVPAGEPSTGQVLTTFRMRDVHPDAISCAYAILINVFDQTIAGSAARYDFDTYGVNDTSSVTFDWEQ